MLTGMRVTTVNSVILAKDSDAALKPVRPAGKTNDSAHFDEKRDDDAGDATRQKRCLRVELVCQQETARHDPFWDGPRLVPVFVAQLLGQVLEQPARVTSVRAYAVSAPVARVFDAAL
jgi:hypothetical protein